MNTIKVFDRTLIGKNLSFKEKLEIVKNLNNFNLDVLELPELEGGLEEEVLVQTLSQVSKAKLSISIGYDLSKLDLLDKYLTNKETIVRIELPVSNVGMEYTIHKKGDKFIAFAVDLVSKVMGRGYKVDFVAIDSTRADKTIINSLFNELNKINIEYITLVDNTSNLSVVDFQSFINSIDCLKNNIGVQILDDYGMALATSVESLKQVGFVKGAYLSDITDMSKLLSVIKDKGNDYGFKSNLILTNHKNTGDIINKIINKDTNSSVSDYEEYKDLDLNANFKKALAILGYDLDEEDYIKVKNEFDRISVEKTVTLRELDVIISTTALQVPATYTLGGYVVNSGDIIKSSAQLTLIKGDEKLFGVEVGDGPIDAAFKAIEKLVGLTFDLDDFQIQSLTEGKEAVGNALVKIRYNGKLFSGNGVSTDIIGSSIKAYLNAVNKVVFEEK